MAETKNLMEELRYKLNRLLEDMDKCDKTHLLKISHQLDEVINSYIKEKKKKPKSKFYRT